MSTPSPLSTPTSRLHEDSGLQPERTALSWNRTTLSLLVCAATMLRWSREYPLVIVIMAVVMATLGIVVVATNQQRYRRRAAAIAGKPQEADVFSVGMITAALLLFGISELVLMVVNLEQSL